MSSRKRPSESGAGLDDSVRPKKAKVNTTAEAKTDSNGDRYWEISKMRRVTISSFRGKTQVNVREYYEKDGQELPGKKGRLIVDQFAAIVSLLPEIEKALKENGETLPRPIYSAEGGQSDQGEQEQASPDNQSPSKQNIEATSDEESEA
ncbi:ssDNA-binding transcriptional regulator [Penicillium mononematosum]|uniref:ssDNA-binding transcriptional regulator n=1 Tax=Penicillium mononematosum TaxID=268346 RepID=UPI002548DF93|nr:ssDNA-binding transcriptional regulator [Penicillium mononematosum]KAJ6180304.1 ssDNA-binding transcriptional regulator [Penicillium mononematosum]